MSEPAKQILDRFKLASVPSVPALLLKGLAIQNGILSGREKSPREVLKDFLQLDDIIYAKVVGKARQAGHSACEPEDLITALGVPEVLSILTRTALASSLSTDRASEQFIKDCWRQSTLVTLLSREVAAAVGLADRSGPESPALCARFLNLGAVVFENIYGEHYRELRESGGRKTPRTELLMAETRRFGCTHAEVGAELLLTWGFSQFASDAVRYQYEAPEHILDASATVRCCWLARQLAGPDEAGHDPANVARTLFSLDGAKVREIRCNAESRLAVLSRKAGLSFPQVIPAKVTAPGIEAIAVNGKEASGPSGERPLMGRIRKFSWDSEPLSDEGESRAASPDDHESADDKDRQALLKQVREIALFTSFPFARAGSVTDLAQAAETFSGLPARLLNGNHVILFAPDKSGEHLVVRASNVEDETVNDISIRRMAARSLVAECLIEGRESKSQDRQTLSVIDRQLLTLLDSPAFFCDPLMVDGKAAGVLVLGMSPQQQEAYLESVHLRAMFTYLTFQALNAGEDASRESRESALEQLVRETVHEASNPLSIIKNYLQLMSMHDSDDEQAHKQLKVIGQEIDRVRDILGRLRDQSGRTETFEETDLNQIISNLNMMLAPSILKEKCISLKLDLDESLKPIATRANAVKQILTNLLKNAADALPGKGEIVVETRNNIHFNNAYYVQIKVSDDGPGIPPEIMGGLYVARMTTKGGSHSGAGLAIVKRLMDELDGLITCQSDNRGTCFNLLLPRKT